jgi:hypothetical protein
MQLALAFRESLFDQWPAARRRGFARIERLAWLSFANWRAWSRLGAQRWATRASAAWAWRKLSAGTGTS